MVKIFPAYNRIVNTMSLIILFYLYFILAFPNMENILTH